MKNEKLPVKPWEEVYQKMRRQWPEGFKPATKIETDKRKKPPKQKKREEENYEG